MHPRVFVLDTSALVEIKKVVKGPRQWDLFVQLSALVEQGVVAFPKQVVREMDQVKYPDTPGAWIAGSVRKLVKYSEPSDDSLAEVLGVAPNLVEADDVNPVGVADPYVAAMATQIAAAWPEAEVIVVTEDRVDRMPLKQSLVSACNELGIATMGARDFVISLGVDPSGLNDPPGQ